MTGYTSQDAATRKFVLLPTGPGEEKNVVIPGLAEQRGLVVGWLPGDQNYLVMGTLPGKQGWQFFSWDASRGALRPVSPERMYDMFPMLSPDGQRFLTRGPDHEWHVYSIGGAAHQSIKGLTLHDVPVNWRADNYSIYIRTHADTNKTFHMSILDLNSGQRTPWKEILPARPVDQVLNLCITPDGRAYAYNFVQTTSDLYLVQGLK